MDIILFGYMLNEWLQMASIISVNDAHHLSV